MDLTKETMFNGTGNKTACSGDKRAFRSPDELSDIEVNVVFIVMASMCLIFSGASFVALVRTRRIPKSARFFSAALLVFDCATTFSFTIRRFFKNGYIRICIQLFGIGWSYMSYMAVGVMTLERLVLFQWPFLYARHAKYKTCVSIFLLIEVSFFSAWTLELTCCFVTFSTSVHHARPCLDPVVIRYMSIAFITNAVISCSCFVKILLIIVKQKQRVLSDNTPRYRNNSNRRSTIASRYRNSSNHRSTIAVFLCCINYLVVAIINLGLIYTLTMVSIIVRRTILDVLYMVNGLMDTLVYVLWYSECRYELLKMLVNVFPSLHKRVERFRVEIFDIMTYTQSKK